MSFSQHQQFFQLFSTIEDSWGDEIQVLLGVKDNQSQRQILLEMKLLFADSLQTFHKRHEEFLSTKLSTYPVLLQERGRVIWKLAKKEDRSGP